jgi:hypothetical protein
VLIVLRTRAHAYEAVPPPLSRCIGDFEWELNAIRRSLAEGAADARARAVDAGRDKTARRGLRDPRNPRGRPSGEGNSAGIGPASDKAAA